MTLRDPSLSLSPPALAVLDALRDAEDGLTFGEIKEIVGGAQAQWVINELCWHRYPVGEDHGRYFLTTEPVSTEAPGERRPARPRESGPASAGTLGQAPDASVDDRLFTLPSVSVYSQEAA